MATARQIAANRENAKKSTGPRDPKAKQRTSQNARKTGVYSKQNLLAEENPADFARLRADYYREWLPQGPTETWMVERIVMLVWRMARCNRAEAGMIDALRRLPKGTGGIPAAYLRDAKAGDSLGRIVGMEVVTFRSYVATIAALEKLQQTREKRSGLAVKKPAALAGQPDLHLQPAPPA